MFSIDQSDIIEFEQQLQHISSRSIPFATKETVNRAVFKARQNAQGNIIADFTIRNPFTLSSIRVNLARGLDIRKQKASVGSVADYLEKQEFGTIKKSKKGSYVNIPTAYSAGQSGSRTRLPRSANKMSKINLRRRALNSVVARIKIAKNSGEKFVYLDLGRKKGIFRILNKKIMMVHDLSRRSVVVPKNPWLYPAVESAKTEMPDIYKKALQFQLRRIGAT